MNDIFGFTAAYVVKIIVLFWCNDQRK